MFDSPEKNLRHLCQKARAGLFALCYLVTYVLCALLFEYLPLL